MIFDANQQKIIDEIDGSVNEIEIRAKIDNGRIVDIMEKLGEGELTESITMIYDDMRRESFYRGGSKLRSVDMKKIKMGIVKVGVFHISFSREDIVGGFDPKKTDSIRFKSRRSYAVLDAHLDITRTMDLNPRTPGILQSFIGFCGDPSVGQWDMELEIKTKNNLETKLVEFSEFLGLNDVIKNQLREIANLMGISPRALTVKQLGKNPVMLDRAVFDRMDLSRFVILEKSDGLRALIKVEDKSNYVIFTDGKTSVEGSPKLLNMLLDAEWMQDGRVKIFDLILLDGKFPEMGYEERIELLRRQKLPAEFEIKKYLAATCENIKYLHKNSGASDGIIFNEIEKMYMHMEIFKWKPAELITFDFLVVPIPDNFRGIKPFVSDLNIYVLMTGCSVKQLRRTGIRLFSRYRELLSIVSIAYADYNPVPFSPDIWREAYVWYSSEKWEKIFVGEFRKTRGNWDLIKVREDKTTLIPNRIFGNDFFVARKHLHELENPLTIENICEKKIGGGPGYFAVGKTDEYEQMTKFNGFVKFNILQYLGGLDRIVDIGSGKGQDIFKYPAVGHITYVEPDKVAFSELNRRLEKARHKYLTVNETYENFTAFPHKFDAVVSNFACHYFLSGPLQYSKFAKYCSGCGATSVILTFMNPAIMNLPLKNEKYSVWCEGGKLYVKHHFSTEAYPENIIDTEALIESMNREKYSLMVRDSFGRFLEFRDLADPRDREYVESYQYLVFRK
jgi:hypothetical protein